MFDALLLQIFGWLLKVAGRPELAAPIEEFIELRTVQPMQRPSRRPGGVQGFCPSGRPCHNTLVINPV